MNERAKGAKVEKRSQIHEQTDNLRGFLSELHEQIENLHNDLGIVLEPSLPIEDKAAKESISLVDLARTIKEFGDSTTSATFKIKDIINRLEL